MPDIKTEVELYKRMQKSPKEFVKVMWGLEPQKKGDLFIKGKHYTWQQEEILESVEKAIKDEAPRRISVRSGHGIGKTATFAWLILWFLFCFKESQIPCTAPSAEQMNDALWKEISKWLQRMPLSVKCKFEVTNTHIRINESPNTWFARAKTARKENPEALAGIHGDYVMLVIDEACYDEYTEILTDDGFKLFKDLKNEKVLSMNNNGEAIFEKPIRTMAYDGEREMYQLRQRGCDFMVTANHKMLYSTRKVSKLRLKEIKDLDSSGNVYFPRKVNFKLKQGNIAKDWVELVAWYLSEGCIVNNNTINITQCPEYNTENFNNILALLKRLNFNYHIYGNQIRFTDKEVAKELKKYGTSFKNKFVPDYIKKSEYANHFLDIFTLGDGYQRKNRRIFYSSSKRMIDDIQEMLFLTGSAGTLSKRKKEEKKWFQNHWIEQKEDAYVVYERQPTSIKYKNPIIKTHKGIVYCVQTKHGNVFIRRNGRCMWSGNSGVPEEIFITAEGALTEPNILVIMISNPTRLVGYFYESHHKDAKNWQTLHFSVLDSPLVDIEYVNRIIEKRGIDSDEYRVQVLGEFPKSDSLDEKGYVALLEEDDLRMTSNAEFVGERVMGIDPSGEGDDTTVWVVRDNFRAKVVSQEQISSEKSIAEKTLTLIDAYDVKPHNVYIDNFGVGANVAKELALSGKQIRVNSLNVGEKSEEDFYINLRAEAFDRMRKWLRQGGELVNHKGWDELLSIRFRRELTGKMKIMGKREMKNNGVKSPNIADALMLTFTRTAVIYANIFETTKKKNYI